MYTKRFNMSKMSSDATEKPMIAPSPSPVSPSPASPSAPPSTPWDSLKTTEAEYTVMMERMAERLQTWQKQEVQEYLIHEWNSVDYWEKRINFLEQSRERYNKMRAWSAETIEHVDTIDEAIKECMDQLDDIWDYADQLEAEYD